MLIRRLQLKSICPCYLPRLRVEEIICVANTVFGRFHMLTLLLERSLVLHGPMLLKLVTMLTWVQLVMLTC